MPRPPPQARWGRFETEVLATTDNRTALADMSGQWIDRFHERKPPKWITLDMDSSVSPTHGAQEGTAWNGHFGCMCYHPLFVFNQFGHSLPPSRAWKHALPGNGTVHVYMHERVERCALRPGNVHGADDWQTVLKPVIARYAGPSPDTVLSGRFRLHHAGVIQNSGNSRRFLRHSLARQSCSAR